MQLKIATDYAVRLILYMAEHRRRVSSKELSDSLGIPQAFVFKVLKKLNKSGMVAAYQGAEGGYILRERPEQISLFDILSVMENTMKISRCMEADRYCSRGAADMCPVRKFYYEMQRQIEAVLKSTTICSLQDREAT